MNKKIGISLLGLVAVVMLFGPAVYAVDSLPSGTPITLGEIYDTMRFVATTIMLMSIMANSLAIAWKCALVVNRACL